MTILLTTHYMEEAQNLCSRVALMDHGKLEEVNTPAGLIDSLGNYTVDEFAGDETHSHYFHSREEAIAYLSGLSGQASLRETTLEDVFVERAGRHLMPSYGRSWLWELLQFYGKNGSNFEEISTRSRWRQ